MRFKHVTEPADAFLARAYVELSSIDFNKSAPGPDKRERRWPDDRPAGHSRSPLALDRMVTRICELGGKSVSTRDAGKLCARFGLKNSDLRNIWACDFWDIW